MSVQFTTTLPDEDQPALGNGVKDEVAVDRETATTNNGSVRIQIRETGQSTWDAEAAGFAEFVGAFDTLTMEFVGRLDGEEYEVRARTETEYRTGAWTAPVAITTKFPGVSSLTATAISPTEVELTWTDNADNEDGQLVVRERHSPSGGWWAERIVEDVGSDTESYTDDGAQPDTEYRYRIRAYTQYAEADSGTATVSTEGVGLSRRRVPPSDWYVEIDHPSGQPLTPTVAGGAEWQPTLNGEPGLPTVSIPVPYDERWREDGLEGQPMRVWLDGVRLPIDRFETVDESNGVEMALVGRGGTELESYVDGVSYSESDIPPAVTDLVSEHTSYGLDIDDPDGDTRADIQMLDADNEPEWEDALATYPFDATDPVELTPSGQVRQLQVGWYIEAEDGTGTAPVVQALDEYSGDEAVRFADQTHSRSWSFSTDHTIPAGELRFAFLRAQPEGSNPALSLRFEGDDFEFIPEDALNATGSETDLAWFSSTVGNDELPPGSYTFEINAGSASGEVFVDVVFPHDDRFEYDFPTELQFTPLPTLTGPREYAHEQTVETRLVTSIERVIGGELTTEFNSIANNQAVAISNDQGSTWIEAANSETVSGTFADASTTISARFTLSAWGDGEESPTEGNRAMAVDLFDLRADLDDTPLLIDYADRGTVAELLTGIADATDQVWSVEWDSDAGEPEIVWSQPGRRVNESTAPIVTVEGSRSIEGSYERVVVFGATREVEAETWSADGVELLSGLAENHVKVDSERVRSPDGETLFERGIDYRVDWALGALAILEDGDMVAGEQYLVDYEWTYRGERTVPGVDADEAVTLREELPSATSERECEQLARGILTRVQDPLVEAQVSLSEWPPDQSLIAALEHPDLPFEGAFIVRGADISDAGGVTLRLGSRQTAGEIVDELREQQQALAKLV